jgi:hypothetical protein
VLISVYVTIIAVSVAIAVAQLFAVFSIETIGNVVGVEMEIVGGCHMYSKYKSWAENDGELVGEGSWIARDSKGSPYETW